MLPSSVKYLVNAAEDTGVKTGILMPTNRPNRTFQATSTGDATIIIQVSNDDVTYEDYIQLNCTSSEPDSYADTAAWPYLRVNITANTGSTTVTVGW